jgi:predicted nucleic acid-binding protein
MVIFDTSLLIDAMKGVKMAIASIESYRGKEDAGITVITKYELLRGVRKMDSIMLALLIDSMDLYELKENGLQRTIEIYKGLDARGKLINELDILIAGIAEANNQVLVTTDKHFVNIQSNNIIVL